MERWVRRRGRGQDRVRGRGRGRGERGGCSPGRRRRWRRRGGGGGKRTRARAQALADPLPALPAGFGEVRTRFAPSPTGNLHVGGARTALYNWLYARQTGGTFVLRVEDTDQARSTQESEEAVLRDLRWMGLSWDEGVGAEGGAFGPYRQSERAETYKRYADQLVADGHAYPCFCTDEELGRMKAEAEEKGLPPIYRGKWATASAEEVQEKLDAGTPHTYRFRVPHDKVVTISDLVRGEVSWNTNTLGDFVLLRSNGLPVYNFCVAVDDATMKISHVLRAEEHLPNTLRQVLVYEALGFPLPFFGHMSLILAPDKSKLSKRHGATSVGEFRDTGYLRDAMLNYLSLLGWNDGTEQEIYSEAELTESFSLDRITKSGAVFDVQKLNWMNQEHLRAMPESEILAGIDGALEGAGLLRAGNAALTGLVRDLCLKQMERFTDCVPEVDGILGYELEETVAGKKAAKVVEDDFKAFALAVAGAWEDGSLLEAVQDAAAWKAWVKELGKGLGRKGKQLFMPLRVAMTGRMQGGDVGQQLEVLREASGCLGPNAKMVDLEERMARLKAWAEAA